jgi:hypothetical protein
MERYVVTAWRKDGKVLAETHINMISAKTAYLRYVEPKNPDSLNHVVILSKMMEEYRHNPYNALKKKK